MKSIPFLLCGVLLDASCGGAKNEQESVNNPEINEAAHVPIPVDSLVAVHFLNEYIKSLGNNVATKDWLKQCGLVTDNYITQDGLAEKEQDTELKRGGEPINLVTGNMDWCEEGYLLRKFDSKTGYVLVL